MYVEKKWNICKHILTQTYIHTYLHTCIHTSIQTYNHIHITYT